MYNVCDDVWCCDARSPLFPGRFRCKRKGLDTNLKRSLTVPVDSRTSKNEKKSPLLRCPIVFLTIQNLTVVSNSHESFESGLDFCQLLSVDLMSILSYEIGSLNELCLCTCGSCSRTASDSLSYFSKEQRNMK